MNPWLLHLNNYRREHKNLSYKQCMINAKQTYKKGGSQFAGYVRRLEAEGKITNESVKRIKNPSAHLMHKYGKNNAAVEPTIEPVVEPVVEPIVEYEPQYDDVNLTQLKNKKRLTKSISNEQADAISKQQELNKINQQKRKRIAKLIKDIELYTAEKYELNQKYSDDLEKLKQLKQTKKNKELYENRIKQNVQDKKMLVVKYSDLFNYLKKHKIDPNNVQEAKQFLKSEYTNKKVGGAVVQLTEKIVKDYLKHVQQFFAELQESDDIELIMHEYGDRIKSINELFAFLRENAKRLNSELTQKEYDDIERKLYYLKTFFEPLPELIDALYLEMHGERNSTRM